jgi:histidinol phosphatase-like enzyme
MYGAPVPGHARALFLDWGGTLVQTRDNRTVIGADGRPVLMPNVAERLARERPHYGACCFIVSNQARIRRGEIGEAEVVARFGWVNEQLGRPFTDWRLCPHGDEHRCACRKPLPGMFLDLAVPGTSTSRSPPMSAMPTRTGRPRAPPASARSCARRC